MNISPHCLALVITLANIYILRIIIIIVMLIVVVYGDFVMCAALWNSLSNLRINQLIDQSLNQSNNCKCISICLICEVTVKAGKRLRGERFLGTLILFCFPLQAILRRVVGLTGVQQLS